MKETDEIEIKILAGCIEESKYKWDRENLSSYVLARDLIENGYKRVKK